MDLNYARSVSETRTRETLNSSPYINEKDHVEHSPWADWERLNKTGRPNTKQAALSDLFGNRWRHDVFDGLREAHEAGGLYNKRLKFRDPPTMSVNDVPPSSGSGASMPPPSHPIRSAQKGPEPHCYPSRSFNRDYYDPSLRTRISRYPSSSQAYEEYDSEGYSADEYEHEAPMYPTPSIKEGTGSVFHQETGERTTSRKIGIPDLLCSEKSAQESTGSHRKGPIRPWEFSSNSSPVVLGGTKSFHGPKTVTSSSSHDGYAPYETRETTQNTSTHDSNTVQSSASTDIRPPGLRHASYVLHEANQSFSRTPTPDLPHDPMYDYASCPSSPTTSTYLPHYDHHRLPSPEPYHHRRLPSPPHDNYTLFRSQKQSRHKRPSASRLHSPYLSVHGSSRDTSESSGYNPQHVNRPPETSEYGHFSHPLYGPGTAMILNVERRPPIPISRDFRPPNYRPNHLFRILRRGPPQQDDTPSSLPVDDYNDGASSEDTSSAPSLPMLTHSPESPNISSERTLPSRSTPVPEPNFQVPNPTSPLCQTTSASMPETPHSASSTLTPMLPNTEIIISHYRPNCTQDATSGILHTTQEIAAPTYYRPTVLPLTAPTVEEIQEVDRLEGSDTEVKTTDSSAKKASQRKLTKRAAGEFSCGFCEKTFTRNFDMLRHQKTIHQNPQPVVRGAQTCPDCHNYFNRRDAYSRHLDKRPGSCFKAFNLRANAQSKAQAPESVQAILRRTKSNKAS